MPYTTAMGSTHTYVRLDPAPHNARNLDRRDIDVEASLMRIVARMDELCSDNGRPLNTPGEIRYRKRLDNVGTVRTARRDACVAWMRENPEASNHVAASMFGYRPDTICVFRHKHGLSFPEPAKPRFIQLIAAQPDISNVDAAKALGISVRTVQDYRREQFGRVRAERSDAGIERKKRLGGKYE